MGAAQNGSISEYEKYIIITMTGHWQRKILTTMQNRTLCCAHRGKLFQSNVLFDLCRSGKCSQ